MTSFDQLPSALSRRERTSDKAGSEGIHTNPDEDMPPPANLSQELMDTVDLEPRASSSRDWFIRCDPGDKSVAECTQFHDTYCDSSGVLHTDDVHCRHDCSVS
jgi:hypothetical protein